MNLKLICLREVGRRKKQQQKKTLTLETPSGHLQINISSDRIAFNFLL